MLPVLGKNSLARQVIKKIGLTVILVVVPSCGLLPPALAVDNLSNAVSGSASSTNSLTHLATDTLISNSKSASNATANAGSSAGSPLAPPNAKTAGNVGSGLPQNKLNNADSLALDNVSSQQSLADVDSASTDSDGLSADSKQLAQGSMPSVTRKVLPITTGTVKIRRPFKLFAQQDRSIPS